MAATIGSFKGNPTISLNPESKYPFSFGLSKAKAILENLEAIKRFVATHDRPAAAPKSSRPDPVDMAYEDQCKAACGL